MNGIITDRSDIDTYTLDGRTALAIDRWTIRFENDDGVWQGTQVNFDDPGLEEQDGIEIGEWSTPHDARR